jgi:O-antigen/teichoic acid export membrane protein
MGDRGVVTVCSETVSPARADLRLPSLRLLLRKGSFAADVLTLTGGAGLAQGVNVLGTFILARIFAPADFGVLALFMAITSFLSTVGSWRYETAIMLPETDEEGANVQALSLLILVGMCILSLVCAALLRNPIAQRLDEQRIAPWLWAVPISLFAWGLYQILTYWCSRMKQFKRLAVSRVSQSLAALGSQLGMFALGFGGSAALVFGWIAGQSVGAVMLAVPVIREDGHLISRSLRWATIRSEFFKYKNFPIYTTPCTFLANAGQQLVFFVLRLFADINVVGLFALARRAVSFPVYFIVSSMNQVFYKKAATEMDSGRLEPFVVNVLKLLVGLTTPLLVLFVYEANLLFGVMLGGVWAASGVYASLLAFSGYMEFLTSWMNRIFDVRGRQDLALAWAVGRDVIVIGFLALALRLTGNPVWSVGVYVALDFLCIVVWLLLAFRIANFVVGNLWQIGGRFLSTGSIAVAMLWIFHRVLLPWPALFVSTTAVLAMSGFIFLNYQRGVQAQ